jgi:hypothetical protein
MKRHSNTASPITNLIDPRYVTIRATHLTGPETTALVYYFIEMGNLNQSAALSRAAASAEGAAMRI